MYSPWSFIYACTKKVWKGSNQEDQFGPIVESLSMGDGIVEVTDYGKVAAVIMSYKHYLWLLARANEPITPKVKLAGSATLVGNLETASQEISDSILNSLNKTASEL